MRNSKFSTKRVSIDTDDFTLQGQLALPKPAGATAVLFIRGGAVTFPASLTFARWQAHLARHGYPSLFFDFPGSGGWTDGKLEDNSLAARLGWATACLRFLLRHTGCEQAVLVGSSMGAHQAVMMAQQPPAELCGLIISAGAIYNDDAVSKPFGEQLNKALHGATTYTNNTMTKVISTTKLPLLVFYGEHDQVIPEPVKAVYAQAAGANFHILKGMSHSYLHEPGEAAELARHLVFSKSVEFLETLEP